MGNTKSITISAFGIKIEYQLKAVDPTPLQKIESFFDVAGYDNVKTVLS